MDLFQGLGFEFDGFLGFRIWFLIKFSDLDFLEILKIANFAFLRFLELFRFWQKFFIEKFVYQNFAGWQVQQPQSKSKCQSHREREQ